MLGPNELNPEYFEVVKCLLGIRESVGIIGGRPRSALYFVGSQDNSLVFLDPHNVQPACTSDSDLLSSLRTFMSQTARLLPLKSVQSSMSAGFYLSSEESLESFARSVEYMKDSLKRVVTVQHLTPEYLQASEDTQDDYIML
jgi:cysteine protease ATG4